MIERFGYPLILFSMLTIVLYETNILTTGIIITLGLNIAMLLVLFQLIALLYGFTKSLVTLYKIECYPLYSPIRDVAITEQQKSMKNTANTKENYRWRIKLKKIITVLSVIILTGIIIISYGNLNYNGNQALAAHSICNNTWSDEKCMNCHANVYSDVVNSYHVQQVNRDVVDGQWDLLFL
jgi:hypothetical protein